MYKKITTSWFALYDYISHRRRMGREAKVKVIASVWEAEFVQFLAALAVLPRTIWMNLSFSSNHPLQFILFFQIDRGKTASAARTRIEQSLPPNRRDDLWLCFSLHPSSKILSQWSFCVFKKKTTKFHPYHLFKSLDFLPKNGVISQFLQIWTWPQVHGGFFLTQNIYVSCRVSGLFPAEEKFLPVYKPGVLVRYICFF